MQRDTFTGLMVELCSGVTCFPREGERGRYGSWCTVAGHFLSISGDPDMVAHDLGEATLLLHIDSEPIQNSYYSVAVGCAA
jgi:hypothetical protein